MRHTAVLMYFSFLWVSLFPLELATFQPDIEMQPCLIQSVGSSLRFSSYMICLQETVVSPDKRMAFSVLLRAARSCSALYICVPHLLELSVGPRYLVFPFWLTDVYGSKTKRSSTPLFQITPRNSCIHPSYKMFGMCACSFPYASYWYEPDYS